MHLTDNNSAFFENNDFISQEISHQLIKPKKLENYPLSALSAMDVGYQTTEPGVFEHTGYPLNIKPQKFSPSKAERLEYSAECLSKISNNTFNKLLNKLPGDTSLELLQNNLFIPIYAQYKKESKEFLTDFIDLLRDSQLARGYKNVVLVGNFEVAETEHENNLISCKIYFSADDMDNILGAAQCFRICSGDNTILESFENGLIPLVLLRHSKFNVMTMLLIYLEQSYEKEHEPLIALKTYLELYLGLSYIFNDDFYRPAEITEDHTPNLFNEDLHTERLTLVKHLDAQHNLYDTMHAILDTAEVTTNIADLEISGEEGLV